MKTKKLRFRVIRGNEGNLFRYISFKLEDFGIKTTKKLYRQVEDYCDKNNIPFVYKVDIHLFVQMVLEFQTDLLSPDGHGLPTKVFAPMFGKDFSIIKRLAIACGAVFITEKPKGKNATKYAVSGYKIGDQIEYCFPHIELFWSMLPVNEIEENVKE